MIAFYFHKTPQIPKGITPNHLYCYTKLQQVSRSFSAVILSLPPELRESICLFYLVCRGLDTIEDDMKPTVEAKEPHLRTFFEKLNKPGWNIKGFGDIPDEIELLENFDRVIEALAGIKPAYFDVIRDIAKKMGNGMADFLTKPVLTTDDYDLYCWYVAGLVGEGLSRLFAVSGLEDPKVADAEKLYRSMGLFLQKTNIIRDYLDDLSQIPPRVWYPKEIWSKYTDRIENFKDPKNSAKAVQCLNHMVANALSHAVDVMDYMKLLKHPDVFRFCAIPQVMAIATLYECYNNPDVFTSEVKIRKPLAVKLILETATYEHVAAVFKEYVKYFKACPNNTSSMRSVLATLEKKLQTK